MKSLFKYLIGLIVVLHSVLPGFSYAECSVCNKSPKELDKYFRVMEELIMLVDVSPKGSTENLASVWTSISMARHLAKTSLVLSKIFPAKVGGDIMGSVDMMYMSEPMRRDREKLTSLDLKISQRMFELSSAQRENEEIPTDVIVQIDNSLQKLGYVKLSKSENGDYFVESNSMTYSGLIDLLWKLNNFYKSLHQNRWYTNTLSSLGEGFREADEEDSDTGREEADNEMLSNFTNNIIDLVKEELWFCKRMSPQSDKSNCDRISVLDFDIGDDDDTNKNMKELFIYIWKMQDDYECSTGLANECHAWKEIADNAQSFFSERIVTDGKRSLDKFVDSAGLLMGVMFGGASKYEEASKQRKEDLVGDYRGPNWRKNAESDKGLLGHVGTKTHFGETSYESRSLRKRVKSMFESKDTDIITKSKDTVQTPKKKRTMKEKIGDFMEGRNIWKFRSVKGKYAEESAAVSLPRYQYEENKFETDEGKEAKIDEIRGDTRSNEEYKWTDQSIQIRSREHEVTKSNMEESFTNTFQNVLAIQGDLQLKSIFSDINHVTHKFPALSASIYQNMDIIGKKNTEGKLYHAMGNVCDLQCTNLGTKCRYHAE